VGPASTGGQLLPVLGGMELARRCPSFLGWANDHEEIGQDFFSFVS